jgi:hypothetical protein
MKGTFDFPVEKIVYVMTDFTDANVNFWRDHPQLKQYFETGQMDSAIFDAVKDTSITLSQSGVTLSAGSTINPICIVANYLFDTLCHDVFQVTLPIPISRCVLNTYLNIISIGDDISPRRHSEGRPYQRWVEACRGTRPP